MAGSSSHLVRERGNVLVTRAGLNAGATVRGGMWLAAALAVTGVAGCQRAAVEDAGVNAGTGGRLSGGPDRTLADPLLSVERAGLEVRSWLTPAEATSAALAALNEMAAASGGPGVVPSEGASVWQRAGLRVAVVRTADLAELETRLRRSDVTGATDGGALAATPALQRADELWLDPGAVFRPVFTGARSGGPVTIGLHDSRWRAGDGSPRLMARVWTAPGSGPSVGSGSPSLPGVLDVQLALQWADARPGGRTAGAATEERAPTATGQRQSWHDQGLVFSRLGLGASLPAGWSMVIWPDLTPAAESLTQPSGGTDSGAGTGRVVTAGAADSPAPSGGGGLGPDAGPVGLFQAEVVPLGEALLRQRRAAGDRAIVLILTARVPASFRLLSGSGESAGTGGEPEGGRADGRRETGR